MVDATNNPIAGSLAIVLFIAAHFVNYKWGQHTKVAYAALILGICGSLVLYASTWAMWASSRIAGFIDGFGGVPSHVAMGAVFGLAVFATIADIANDPEYNRAAIWALLIGPVFAHGTAGWVYVIGEVIYGGLTIVVQSVLTEVLGSLQ